MSGSQKSAPKLGKRQAEWRDQHQQIDSEAAARGFGGTELFSLPEIETSIVYFFLTNAQHATAVYPINPLAVQTATTKTINLAIDKQKRCLGVTNNL